MRRLPVLNGGIRLPHIGGRINVVQATIYCACGCTGGAAVFCSLALRSTFTRIHICTTLAYFLVASWACELENWWPPDDGYFYCEHAGCIRIALVHPHQWCTHVGSTQTHKNTHLDPVPLMKPEICIFGGEHYAKNTYFHFRRGKKK